MSRWSVRMWPSLSSIQVDPHGEPVAGDGLWLIDQM